MLRQGTKGEFGWPVGTSMAYVHALCRDVNACVEALEKRDETIGLCQSYASNTSGGMDAEARLRRIYGLCCGCAAIADTPDKHPE